MQLMMGWHAVDHGNIDSPGQEYLLMNVDRKWPTQQGENDNWHNHSK